MAAEARDPKTKTEFVEALRVGDVLRLQAVTAKLQGLAAPSSQTETGRVAYLLTQVRELAPIADDLHSHFPGAPTFSATSWQDIKETARKLYKDWQDARTRNWSQAPNIVLSPDMKEAIAQFRGITVAEIQAAQEGESVETYLSRKFGSQRPQEQYEYQRQQPRVPGAQRIDLAAGMASLRVKNSQDLLNLLRDLDAPIGDEETAQKLQTSFTALNVRDAVEWATRGLSETQGRKIAETVYMYYLQGVLYSMEDSLRYHNFPLRSLDKLRTDWDAKLPML